jgi:glutamate-1-semialdehyde 2,1-aminomutase
LQSSNLEDWWSRLKDQAMPKDVSRFQKSDALRRVAAALIPGGAHTYAKGDDQFPQLSPGFIARGRGCHVWDVDGNRFIEYGMGLRSVTLGHAHPEVIAAAAREFADGCNFTRPSPIEVTCAETLLGLVPGAEMVKFCKDGSDATSGAVKLARAYTGRDLIAICADHPFFSVDDWFIGTTGINAGIPKAIRKLTLKFRYNDLASIEALFAAHPGRIAALVMEPERTEAPRDGFLEKARALAHANGALLVFDEMITGFRWHNGGAQTLYGVTPDLSCFGKAMANGFSVSALAGRREIMRLGGLQHTDRERVFLLSTTHGGETHALAAAIATMSVYRREPVIETLERQGGRLMAGLTDAIAHHRLQRHIKLSGRTSLLLYATLDDEGRSSQAFRTLLLQETIRRGVLAPSLVVSYAHTDADIDRTVEAFDGAFEIYARALEDGVARHLVGPATDVVYRRYNVPAAPVAPALPPASTPRAARGRNAQGKRMKPAAGLPATQAT